MNKIGHLLKKAVGRDEVLATARAQTVLRRWPEIVGEFLAERSSPDRFDKGVVWVAVSGSSWAQELRMRKPDILERLKSISTEPELFKDLRFGVRPLRKLPDPEDKAEKPKQNREALRQKTIREIADERLRNWPSDS